MPYKALQMSYKSYFNQQAPIKQVKIGKNGKTEKKTSPKLEICGNIVIENGYLFHWSGSELPFFC